MTSHNLRRLELLEADMQRVKHVILPQGLCDPQLADTVVIGEKYPHTMPYHKS